MRNNNKKAGPLGGSRPQTKVQYRSAVGPKAVAVFEDQRADHIEALEDEIDALFEVLQALPYALQYCRVSDYGLESLAGLGRSRLAELRALRRA